MFNSNCASIPLVANIDGNNGNGMFGNDSWIGLIIILALLSGGFGNGGFGFGGFGGGNRGCVEPCATQADVRAAVDQQTLISKLDQQTYGLADSTYALNNGITTGFAGVQQTLCQGFNGVNTAILQSANGTERGFANLSSQLASCCCETGRAIERGFADTNYNMASQACDTRNLIQSTTRDIIDGQNANTRAILDFMVQSKMDEKDSKISQLETELMLSRQNAYFTANQDAQTAELIRRMGKDCPVNAVVVQPPQPVTFPTNCCGQFSGYGYGTAVGV